MIYGVLTNPARMRTMTTMEITGTVRRTVTIGFIKCPNPGRSAPKAPSSNPARSAIDIETINRSKVDPMADRPNEEPKIAKKARNTEIGPGRIHCWDTERDAMTQIRKRKKTDAATHEKRFISSASRNPIELVRRKSSSEEVGVILQNHGEIVFQRIPGEVGIDECQMAVWNGGD